MKAQQAYRSLHQQLSYRLEHNVSLGIKRFFENGNVWILADTIWYEGFREVLPFTNTLMQLVLD